MSKRILLTEWGVEPRVFGLDEFIKTQTTDADGNRIMPEDGGMSDNEVDSIRKLRPGGKVRIGDADCTEIFVERVSDYQPDYSGFIEPDYRMVDGELKLDGPVTIQISEETYEKLSDYASDRNISLDEALVAAVNRNDVVLRNQPNVTVPSSLLPRKQTLS